MPGVAGALELRTEQIGEVQEPERAEPVVERDDHDVALLRERGAVVPRCVTGSEHERAAVDPHHHRSLGVVARGRPHVEIEAVLAGDRFRPAEHRVHRERALRALRRELGRVAHTVPRVLALRCHPAPRADRRRRVRDSLEHGDAVVLEPSTLPLRVCVIMAGSVGRAAEPCRRGAVIGRDDVAPPTASARRPGRRRALRRSRRRRSCGRTRRLLERARPGSRRCGRRARPSCSRRAQ